MASLRAAVRELKSAHQEQVAKVRHDAGVAQSNAVAAAVATAVAEGSRLQAEQGRLEHEQLVATMKADAERQVAEARAAADAERQAAVRAVKEAAEAAERDAVVRAVMSARAEYEAVMGEWEQKTEAWRRQTIAACEKSLNAARQQISASRKVRVATPRP